MIKPLDNWKAVMSLHYGYVFPPLRFLRRSILDRQCYALTRADRYLAEADWRLS